MPGTERQTGADGAATTEVAPDADLGTEEGLANALSAFLAQLHTGFDDDQGVYGMGVPDLSATSSLNKLPVAPTGAAAARGSAPLPHRQAVAARLQPTKLPPAPAPRAPQGATTGPRVTGDGWTAAAALAGQRDGQNARHAVRTGIAAAAARPVPAQPAGQAPAGKPRSVAGDVGTKTPATGGPATVTASRPATATASRQRPGAPTAVQLGATAPATAVATVEPVRPEPANPTARRSGTWRGPRPRAIAAGAAALALVAGLAGAVAWGSGLSSRLGSTSAQLSATRAELVSARAGASAATARVGRQLVGIRALDHQFSATRARLARVDAELATTQGRLAQAQAQVAQAQGRLGEAQGRLGSTQHNLVATQAHATVCEQGAQLGQQSLQVFGSLVLLQTDYLTASQSSNRSQMRSDLARMRSLEKQAQSIGPRFASSVALCTRA